MSVRNRVALLSRLLRMQFLYDQDNAGGILLKGNSLRILGIDPGFGKIGYGVIDVNGTKAKSVCFGVIETDVEHEIPERLNKIFEDISKLIEDFRPDETAVEQLFFFRNVTTAIQVGEARGVILLALQRNGLPIFEYTPKQVKQAVTGYGKAEKGQIQKTMKLFLSLDSAPKPDDAADALAVAWCHFLFRASRWREKS